MAMKRVMFSAGGSLGTSCTQKNFTMSTVQMKVKDNRKSLKMRFRMMIRDYTNMFKKSHDEAIEKTFKQDLMIILQEAFANVMDGHGTLNMNLGLTMLVPGARKINNKLNLLLKKINKFFKKQGYLSPMLQKQFYKLVPELIQSICDKVGSGEVNEEELNKDEETETTVKKIAASSTKRIFMSASEETIEQIMNQIDLDEYPIEEVTPNSIVFATDKLPEVFKSLNFTGMRYRSRCFNSEMVNIVFVMPKVGGEDYQSTFDKAIRMLKLRGIIGTKVDPDNLDYSANDLDEGNIKYTVSVMADNIKLKKEDEEIGVYPGKELPEGWVVLTEQSQDPYPEITALIDAGLTTGNLMRIESLLNGKDQSEKEAIRSALIVKYGNNPIANLL